jgi:hypothetical protein
VEGFSDFVCQGGFGGNACGATPVSWQAEALEHLIDQDRVSIRSGHGVGKSTLDAWTILWFHCTHYPAKTGVVAPTLAQIQDVLWAEIALWMKKLPDVLSSQFAMNTSAQDLRLYLKEAPESSFAAAKAGRKDRPEALQGLHSENMLLVLDEASGIDEVVFEAGQGALSTEGAKILMTSNPTRTSGYFYDSHHKNRDRWHCMKVSCFDSPLVSKTYIDNMAADYGEDSSIYAVRVLGDFPATDDDTLIPLDLVEAAKSRDVAKFNVMPVWGLDVARYGDCRTALAKRQGNHLTEPVKSWSQRDLMEVAGILQAEYEDAPSDQRPAEILIDAVGLGAGVLDRAKELRLPVRGINVGETASGRDRFMNLKAELWWRAREWFEARDCHIGGDEKLIAQLCTVRYQYQSSGKIKVEGKEDMQKRGLRSPDEADAFILTFAGGTKRFEETRYAMPKRRRKLSSWMSR